jgi:hypothetical protein
MVQLLEHLLNMASPLARVLNAFPDGLPEPREPVQPQLGLKRLGNGVVRRTVEKVLAAADEPMRVGEIRAAAEKLLGQPVPNQSVLWTLHMGVKGDLPRFKRVAHGHYRLAH